MKYLVAAIAAFAADSAFAHSGHTAPVDGHSHTIFDLAMMGLVPVLAGAALVGLALWSGRQRND